MVLVVVILVPVVGGLCCVGRIMKNAS
ncbi:uncharacterized protein METZ01_LOCUS474622, partial [marine metagenome]